MKLLFTVAVFSILIVAGHGSIYAGWQFDFETGLAFNSYNDVRIPGNTGTDISLTDDLESEKSEFFRLRFTNDIGSRSSISFLIAPLRINASGRLDKNLDFNGTLFDSGSMIWSK